MEIVAGAFEMGDTDRERGYEQFEQRTSDQHRSLQLIPWVYNDPSLLCIHCPQSND